MYNLARIQIFSSTNNVLFQNNGRLNKDWLFILSWKECKISSRKILIISVGEIFMKNKLLSSSPHPPLTPPPSPGLTTPVYIKDFPNISKIPNEVPYPQPRRTDAFPTLRSPHPRANLGPSEPPEGYASLIRHIRKGIIPRSELRQIFALHVNAWSLN